MMKLVLFIAFFILSFVSIPLFQENDKASAAGSAVVQITVSVRPPATAEIKKPARGNQTPENIGEFVGRLLQIPVSGNACGLPTQKNTT